MYNIYTRYIQNSRRRLAGGPGPARGPEARPWARLPPPGPGPGRARQPADPDCFVYTLYICCICACIYFCIVCIYISFALYILFIIDFILLSFERCTVGNTYGITRIWKHLMYFRNYADIFGYILIYFGFDVFPRTKL